MSGDGYENFWNGTSDGYEIYKQYFLEEYQRYELFSYVVFGLECVLALIGIIANFIICVVLLRKKRIIKNFSNFHLFNLALTDIIFRLALTPLLFTIEYNEVKHGNNAVCKLGAFGSYTTLAGTFMLLLGIAFDRYFHIVHPIKARYITWRHSRNAVIFSWFYAAACSSPLLYSMRYTKTDWNVTSDTEYEICLSTVGLPFQISSSVFLFFAFLVPLAFMAVAYGKILKVLWQRARSNVINSQVAKAKFRAVKMMIVVVLAYFISWGPKLVWVCLQAFEIVSLEYTVDWESEEVVWEDIVKEERKHINLLIIDDAVDLFAFTSSVLNPLIFGYYNKTFREELKRCCCGVNCSKCFVKCKAKSGKPNTLEKPSRSETISTPQNVCVMQDKDKTDEKICFAENRTKTREVYELMTKL